MVSSTEALGVHVNLVDSGQMIDIEPIGFEVTRDGNDGEKIRVLYSKPNDKFF